MPTKPLHEITHEAIRLLCQDMGVVDTLRFLRQFDTRRGNYTEERESLFGDLGLDEVLDQIRRGSEPEQRT